MRPPRRRIDRPPEPGHGQITDVAVVLRLLSTDAGWWGEHAPHLVGKWGPPPEDGPEADWIPAVSLRAWHQRKRDRLRFLLDGGFLGGAAEVEVRARLRPHRDLTEEGGQHGQ